MIKTVRTFNKINQSAFKPSFLFMEVFLVFLFDINFIRESDDF